MAREQRRLAAIIAADVVGYSRLMGRDESGTLARLRENRKVRLEPALARHGGRLVKLTGDGALIEFSSAVDALAAAIGFQQEMAEVNREQTEDTAIVFRVGLHLGDLIVDGDDLYGDGVNVASRLETEAPPGGIVISGNVHDAVAGRLKATFDDLGQLSLKNIERPMQAFGVKWRAADWNDSARSASATTVAAEPLALPDKPSIAVLPFQNMSGDPEQEYFADGMVEDVITSLARFKSLFVVARNSSFAYKGKSPDIRKVGQELGVRYVLEGSVRKAGTRLRITGQLIDAMSGAHLWADRFDGAIEDVFELQDQVTTSVVGAIAPKLEQAEIERARRKPAQNLDAYDFYLRGLSQMLISNKEALRLFNRAIELDPDFAPPYGLAARCYSFRRVLQRTVDLAVEVAEARRLAERVVVIGQDDAQALSWAGLALVELCRDYETGEELIDQAAVVNPGFAVGWINRGVVSSYLGRQEAAIEQLARALRLSPLDSESYRAETTIAIAHVLLGKPEEALPWARKAFAHRPGVSNMVLITTLSHCGKLDDAREVAARTRQMIPGLTVSNLRESIAWRRPEDLNVLMEGLRLAGIPE